jgi:ABC-type amino acid transport substrate-binding protein
VVLAGALAGCTAIPADPDGTLDRVRGGELRVGATERPPWVALTDGPPEGTEPDLVLRFAERLDADVRWVTGSEQQLVGDLEDGELDLVIGGIPADSPWSEHAGMTRPYVTDTDERGRPLDLVMLVPNGENRFLFELERFLESEAAG